MAFHRDDPGRHDRGDLVRRRHHVRNGLGIGGPIADLPDPKGSGELIQVPKADVQRYTGRSFESVSARLQESLFLAFLVAVAGTVTAAHFLRQSGRSATEDRHIRGTTIAPPDVVAALAKASHLAYDFTLAGIPLFREAETDHILVCGAPGSGKGVAIKELLDQIRARGDRAILYDPSGEYVQVYYRHGRDVLVNPLDARSRPWTLWGEVREAYDYASLAASIIPETRTSAGTTRSGAKVRGDFSRPWRCVSRSAARRRTPPSAT